MADSTDFRHLELALAQSGKRKKKENEYPPQPEIVKQNKNNRGEHSRYLYGKAAEQIADWSKQDNTRAELGLPKLPADKSLLIKIPTEDLDIDYLRATFGFEVVCEYDDGLVIVATNPEAFTQSIEKIRDFAANVKGTGNVARICDMVVEETKRERLSRILSEELNDIWGELKSKPDECVIVEASIECLGTTIVPDVPQEKNYQCKDKYERAMERWTHKQKKAYEEWDEICRKREAEIERFIADYSGEVLAIYDYAEEFSKLDSFELKMRISVKCLIDFAENYPYVFEITFPDDFETVNLYDKLDTSISLKYELIGPEDGAPTVCVVDSGIQEGHLYIKDAIKGGMSKSYLPGVSSVADEIDEGGHGTRVAGAMLYPNGVSHIKGEYVLPCYIANARVLDENNVIPDRVLPSKLVNELVRDFNEKHRVRLFNHSIAADSPCRKKYMSAWAAAIDNASFELDVLFLQAAGNLYAQSSMPQKLGIQQHLDANRRYPDYLLEDVCRIANPAQSTQALTVGSICSGEYEDADLKSFGTTGAVSSFSRCGHGMWNSIKPEVVEYGGDWICSKHNNSTFVSKPEVCPELIRRSPEGPPYAKDASGTSFAAPKVAHIAAALQRTLPSEPALLYKALIVQSARWTPWAEAFPEAERLNVLKYMGFGLPNLEKATTNNDFRITFITTGVRQIQGGSVHVYKVSVPNEIRGLSAEIRVDVTLTFSAKPRRTRKGYKGYFSTWVDWSSSRFGETLEAFVNRVLQPESVQLEDESCNVTNGKGFSWTLGAQNNHGKIKNANRNNSATQKDWSSLPAYQLPEEFCIAVKGHSGWSNNGEHFAKYALAISFEAVHSNVELYIPFKVLVENEVKVETEQEIEINDISEQL